MNNAIDINRSLPSTQPHTEDGPEQDAEHFLRGLNWKPTRSELVIGEYVATTFSTRLSVEQASEFYRLGLSRWHELQIEHLKDGRLLLVARRIIEPKHLGDADVFANTQPCAKAWTIPSPPGHAYKDFQMAGIWELIQRDKCLLGDDMGLGKAQPIDTPILTPDGWKPMGDIQIGDKVIGSDGQPTRVVGVYPQGCRNVWRVTFSDGTSTECDYDHLWEVTTSVRKYRGSDPLVKKTGELLSEGLHDKHGNRKWEIPIVSGSCEFRNPEQHLPIDAWLLGVLIGDGGFSQKSVYLSNPEPEILERVENTIKPMGLHLKKTEPHRENRCDYRLTHGNAWKPNPIKNILESLDLMGKLSYQKHIPRQYLFASAEERLALLQGLMDTDGYISAGKRGAAQISTSSKRLAEDIKFLVQSLGGLVRQRIKKTTHRDAYVLTISLPSGMQPFWLKRKRERYPNTRPKYQPTRRIESIEFSRVANSQCIKVENGNGLYLTNDCIVTHNTIQSIGMLNYLKPTRVAIVAPAGLKQVWQAELKKWLTFETPVRVENASTIEFFKPYPGIYVTNYEALRSPGARKFLEDPHWDQVILDESHRIKNPDAKVTQAILGGFDEKGNHWRGLQAPRKLLLSGTPMPNKGQELWTTFSYLFPNVFSQHVQKDFYRAFAGRGGRHYVANSQRLRRWFRAITIRRRKATTLQGLPPKRRTTQLISVSASAMTRLHEMENHALADIIAGYGQTVSFEKWSAIRAECARLKAANTAEVVIRFLIENPTKKLVVFRHHAVMRHALSEALNVMGIKHVYYEGKMSQEAKFHAVEQFQNDVMTRCIIVSIKSGGLGITLTAAQDAIFAEIDCVPSDLLQCEDRLHRISQQSAVNITYLYIHGSIEQHMGNIVCAKIPQIERVVDDEKVDPDYLVETVVDVGEILEAFRDNEQGWKRLYDIWWIFGHEMMEDGEGGMKRRYADYNAAMFATDYPEYQKGNPAEIKKRKAAREAEFHRTHVAAG